MCACVLSHFSCVQLFVTLRTVACQAPLSMGFSKQEYWSGLPFCPPGDLSGPGIELSSLRSSDLAGRFFTTGATWEAHTCVYVFLSHGEKVGYWGEKESKTRGRWQIRLLWVCTGLLGPFEPLKAGADIPCYLAWLIPESAGPLLWVVPTIGQQPPFGDCLLFVKGSDKICDLQLNTFSWAYLLSLFIQGMWN